MSVTSHEYFMAVSMW